MIVIFGANGRTGRAIVQEAILRKIPFRAVVKNDHDTDHLTEFISVNDLFFADADHKESLSPALEGATGVISCIGARTAGFGSPQYDKFAASNIVHAAHEHNIKRILSLSVMGAFRWSPNLLNQQNFHMDLWVRRSQVPWTLLRVSCYHDELIDGHVRPPDGKSPHPLRPSSRYAPVSRRDVARAVMDIMPNLLPSRTWLIGGPEVFTGKQLQDKIRKYQKGSGPKTMYGPLPPGDVSVSPESSLIMVGAIPTETLDWALDPTANPLPSAPFWNRNSPDYHQTDQKKNIHQLSSMNKNLRFAVHKLLFEDLKRIGIEDTNVTFDFSQAEIPINAEHVIAHKSALCSMTNVHICNAKEESIFRGSFEVFYDDLADELQIWWCTTETDEIPQDIWALLDLGTKRRIHKHPRWGKTQKSREFMAEQHK